MGKQPKAAEAISREDIEAIVAESVEKAMTERFKKLEADFRTRADVVAQEMAGGHPLAGPHGSVENRLDSFEQRLAAVEKTTRHMA